MHLRIHTSRPPRAARHHHRLLWNGREQRKQLVEIVDLRLADLRINAPHRRVGFAVPGAHQAKNGCGMTRGAVHPEIHESVAKADLRRTPERLAGSHHRIVEPDRAQSTTGAEITYEGARNPLLASHLASTAASTSEADDDDSPGTR